MIEGLRLFIEVLRQGRFGRSAGNGTDSDGKVCGSAPTYYGHLQVTEANMPCAVKLFALPLPGSTY